MKKVHSSRSASWSLQEILIDTNIKLEILGKQCLLEPVTFPWSLVEYDICSMNFLEVEDPSEVLKFCSEEKVLIIILQQFLKETSYNIS